MSITSILMIEVWLRDFRRWYRRNLRRYFGWNVKPEFWGSHVLFRFRKKKELELINYKRLQENLLRKSIEDAKAVKEVALNNSRGLISGSVPRPFITSSRQSNINALIALGDSSKPTHNHKRYVYIPEDHYWVDVKMNRIVYDVDLIRTLETSKEIEREYESEINKMEREMAMKKVSPPIHFYDKGY